jgi:hypothetical protein
MKTLPTLLAIAVHFSFPALATESTFALNNEGWKVIDHTSSTNPLPTSGVVLSDLAPSAVDGALVVRDLGNNWNWIVAPAKFHGDWSDFSRLEIDFVTDDAVTLYNLRLFISDGSNSASYEFPIANTPADTVLNLSVPLSASEWQVIGTWEQLVANVNAFYVRMDLNNNVAGEVDFVDRIALLNGPEPPDRFFPVKFGTEIGRSYQIESSSDLRVWRNVGDPMAGDGSEKTVQVMLSDSPQRFFRARRLGSP